MEQPRASSTGISHACYFATNTVLTPGATIEFDPMLASEDKTAGHIKGNPGEERDGMQFGITFKGDGSADRTRYLVRQAEAAGFEYAWFFDSHILWRDSYVAMAMCMEHTRSMRFGPCVTNPGVREWSVAASLFGSLAFQSGGRLDIGVGRGDSSLRVMGKPPAGLDDVVAFSTKIKEMIKGNETTYDGCAEPVHLEWSPGYEVPIWIAAYGPKAIKVAGEAADGLILQIAEPAICRWLTDQALLAGENAGRDMSTYQVMAAAPAYIGPMDVCIERTKWFPAMVGNHAADIVERYGKDTDAVPRSLIEYIENRRGYDYRKHGRSDNPFLDFITPDVVQGFAILGSAEDHIEKLTRLQESGVTQFNIYLDNGEEERLIAEYGTHVIPSFR